MVSSGQPRESRPTCWYLPLESVFSIQILRSDSLERLLAPANETRTSVVVTVKIGRPAAAVLLWQSVVSVLSKRYWN